MNNNNLLTTNKYLKKKKTRDLLLISHAISSSKIEGIRITKPVSEKNLHRKTNPLQTSSKRV